MMEVKANRRKGLLMQDNPRVASAGRHRLRSALLALVMLSGLYLLDAAVRPQVAEAGPGNGWGAPPAIDLQLP